jgi:hypothetical protein
MPRFLPLLILALTVGLTSAHAQSSSAAEARVIGTWSGTYGGDASGKFTMVFSRDAAKKLTGTVEVVPETGTGYTATFKSVAVDGNTVNWAYDEPDNDNLEIQLQATVDGDSLAGGAWKTVNLGTHNVLASGTFTGARR